MKFCVECNDILNAEEIEYYGNACEKCENLAWDKVNSDKCHQSRSHSIIEAVTSTVIGYIVAVIATQLIFPRFGLPVRFDQNLAISGFFTVISLIRSYFVRRFFNWWCR